MVSEKRFPSPSPQTSSGHPIISSFHLNVLGDVASLHHPPYPSIFICPSFSLSLLFSIPLRPCLFPSSCFYSSPPHVVLLFIPLYSFPPSPPPLSSLAHIWFPSGSVCVWCYPEFSGAPCSYGCVFCRRRERCRVCVCVRVCIEFSRLCNSFICGSFGETSPCWSSIFFILPLFIYPEWRPA